MMSDHPRLPSARILLDYFSQNPPLPLVFSLSNYYPLVLFCRTLLLGYKCALYLFVIQTEETTLSSTVKPHSSSPYTYFDSHE